MEGHITLRAATTRDLNTAESSFLQFCTTYMMKEIFTLYICKNYGKYMETRQTRKQEGLLERVTVHSRT